MDEIERKMFFIKMQYEKYFSGIERIEPLKEREDLKRTIRDVSQEPMNNTQQRYRFTQLKARMSSLEMYWQRNLVMIERGTHPKMKFRANLKQQQQREQRPAQLQQQQQRQTTTATTKHNNLDSSSSDTDSCGNRSSNDNNNSKNSSSGNGHNDNADMT